MTQEEALEASFICLWRSFVFQHSSPNTDLVSDCHILWYEALELKNTAIAGEFRPEQAPPAIAKLVDDCLNDDPELRPTAADCLKVLLDNRPVRH